MADDNKNPLDVLEELLKQSGGGAGTGGAGVGAVAAGKASLSADEVAKIKEEAEKKLAEELEVKRLELEQHQVEQSVVDEVKMAEQREEIVKIKDSDEYKARIQQDSDKKASDDNKIIAGDGFEIDQLDHKKV
ncbi:MAG: hypothetical protein COZ34_03570 [Candidatus Pacebacteria bacterium CG_4_10_14_3_um_filter_34_15]|nr:hypothetical protein [Candidatus Pacearchaeota archaeon]NCQ65405.1 hypothetical protein [Candidatus Paceibacterota bacterium]OIO44216.1 MAG: hypothetical protein AUJ41_03465 [Candidatus Pacebacteria bacterium CG1_02_43_31]PIQ80788.1 MAG: hypothetical protein COV78_03785 [Candidatus Pacebacteria bacterium CG11_big_fil_rev_8_21_14_0_20_34_55]PIX81399.1 MAG: hypothetical protein COZ34_03570 [Candidatus Pacebacteria bacterium CG_4_10_14_3_um_filter_34_15]PJC43872.1 MAG: hypothetical protein CO0